MKNTTILAITLAAIIIIGIGVFMKTNSPDINPIVDTSTESAQQITLSLKNYNYYPNTITVKQGEPVSISLDKTVAGCLRDFTIPEFGVSQYLATPADTVEFTPNKKGTFRFQCSMGMGFGTIIVQ